MVHTENINIKLAQPLLEDFPSDKRLSRFSILALREYPIHAHLHMEVVYVMEGSLSIKVGVSNYTISAGEFTIINPFELHSLCCTGEPNLICLLEISPRFYDPCEEGTIFVSEYNLYREAADEDFEKILDALKKIFYLHLSSLLAEYGSEPYIPAVSKIANAEYEKMLLRTLINYFELHFTAEYFLLSDHKENTLRDSLVQADRLKNILSYFYENFPRKIQLQDVADHTFVNRYHISHLVKSGIGFTFSDLLQHIRIEKAELYLLGTDLPISQIVFELGFSSYRYFNQHFKQLFEMTPNAYRKKFQKETIRHKAISTLEPIRRQAAERMVNAWKEEIQGSRIASAPFPVQLISLNRSLALIREKRGLVREQKKSLNWPPLHVLYDSPYLPALLLSRMTVSDLPLGPDFIKADDSVFQVPAASSPFVHRPEAITSCGMKKALFHMLAFIRQFSPGTTRSGPGYFLSDLRGAGCGKICLLVYHAPIDIGELLFRNFSDSRELLSYVGPQPKKLFSVDFQGLDLQGLTFRFQSLKLEGDPFCQWERMGCPDVVDQDTVQVLNETSRPDVCFDRPDPETLQYRIELEPFAVRLYTFI